MSLTRIVLTRDKDRTFGARYARIEKARAFTAADNSHSPNLFRASVVFEHQMLNWVGQGSRTLFIKFLLASTF